MTHVRRARGAGNCARYQCLVRIEDPQGLRTCVAEECGSDVEKPAWHRQDPDPSADTTATATQIRYLKSNRQTVSRLQSPLLAHHGVPYGRSLERQAHGTMRMLQYAFRKAVLQQWSGRVDFSTVDVETRSMLGRPT